MSAAWAVMEKTSRKATGQGGCGSSCRDCSATARFWCEYNCGVPKERKASDKSSPYSRSGGEPATQAPHVPRWSPATRVAFRFCFVYLGLFYLGDSDLGQHDSQPQFLLPGPGKALAHARRDVLDCASMFSAPPEWMMQAAAGTALFLGADILAGDRGCARHGDLVRSSTAGAKTTPCCTSGFVCSSDSHWPSAMFEYGMTKVIPTQFPRHHSRPW